MSNACPRLGYSSTSTLKACGLPGAPVPGGVPGPAAGGRAAADRPGTAGNGSHGGHPCLISRLAVVAACHIGSQAFTGPPRSGRPAWPRCEKRSRGPRGCSRGHPRQCGERQELGRPYGSVPGTPAPDRWPRLVFVLGHPGPSVAGVLSSARPGPKVRRIRAVRPCWHVPAGGSPANIPHRGICQGFRKGRG